MLISSQKHRVRSEALSPEARRVVHPKVSSMSWTFRRPLSWLSEDLLLFPQARRLCWSGGSDGFQNWGEDSGLWVLKPSETLKPEALRPRTLQVVKPLNPWFWGCLEAHGVGC